jgi:RNA polymerase sigma factor for flagellar operon FliA
MNKEDLIQYGVCGLIEAVERFDPNQGAKFETYAAQRIRGAVLDQIRHYGKTSGGLSRSAMSKLKMVEKATRKLETELKRHPNSKEIADELNMSMDEYSKVLGEISYGTQISLDEMVGLDRNISAVEIIKNDNIAIPEDEIIDTESNKLLGEAINGLPEKENIIIYLYYYEEMTLKEIGEYLNLSESRISQLHTQAMLRLRNKLTGGD